MAKVDSWTVKELVNIGHNTEYPICLQISQNEYWVGTHKIFHIGPNHWRVEHNDKLVHEFYSQQAAIFYAVYYKCKLYKSADALLWSDQAVVKSDTEVKLYSSKLANNKKVDEFKYQLWVTMLDKARSELELARKDLKKNLDLAKYNKIWEKIL
jgi:hypothetical protein